MSRLTKTVKIYGAIAAFLLLPLVVVLPALALEPSPTPTPTPFATVTPDTNLPRVPDEINPAMVTVTGSGLVPGAFVGFVQKSVSLYSEAEGDPIGMTGVKEEILARGGTRVGIDGTFTKQAIVSYDVFPGGTTGYCDNDNTPGVERRCYLEIRYAEAQNSAVIAQKNLYFQPAKPAQPANKDECKDDKWKTFTSPSFKNQGQCVSSITSENAK